MILGGAVSLMDCSDAGGSIDVDGNLANAGDAL